MKPTGPLMVEHRLNERMLALLADERRKINETGAADIAFLDAILDFFRTYVDKFHHGKEEEILFKEIAAKPISPDDRKMLNELIEEQIVQGQWLSGLPTSGTNKLIRKSGQRNS